ncbi:hypothetical protein CFB40_14245 [Burkholderia sp. AU31652]|nr:hypothetical protein CFB40_14245 [Burkholderia sp. AU31652]
MPWRFALRVRRKAGTHGAIVRSAVTDTPSTRRLVTAGAYCMVCKGLLHTIKMCSTARRLAAKASFHLARTFMRATGKEVDFYSSAIIRHTAQMMRLIKPGIDVDRCSTKPQCD